ncbi:MAG: helix-turn-helix domain-containing protein [Peptoniphilaceae bacterium]
MLANREIITLNANINYTDISHLGGKIKFIRQAKNLTIKELSIISNVSQNTISNIEKNNTAYISTIKKIADALSTTTNYLLDLNNFKIENNGDLITKLRLQKGLSQNNLADLCNLNQSTIKDYEKGNLRNKKTYDYVINTLKNIKD